MWAEVREPGDPDLADSLRTSALHQMQLSMAFQACSVLVLRLRIRYLPYNNVHHCRS